MDLEYRYMLRCIEEVAAALSDASRVIIQGITEHNAAARGNVAVALERAAAYARGRPFDYSDGLRVIIESPYANADSHIHRHNIIYACRCMQHSLSLGESPFASHLLYTQPNILDDKIPEQRKRGIHAGLKWMSCSHAVAVYKDRGISPGMEQGIAYARSINLPIIERTIGDNPDV